MWAGKSLAVAGAAAVGIAFAAAAAVIVAVAQVAVVAEQDGLIALIEAIPIAISLLQKRQRQQQKKQISKNKEKACQNNRQLFHVRRNMMRFRKPNKKRTIKQERKEGYQSYSLDIEFC